MKLLSIIFLVIFLASAVNAQENEPEPEDYSVDKDYKDDEKGTKNKEDVKVPEVEKVEVENNNDSELSKKAENQLETVDDIEKEDDWICDEIGPDKENKKIDVQYAKSKVIVSHVISNKNMEELRGKSPYNSDDINCVIDRRRGDKYERYPMKCSQNKTNSVVKFYDHPFVTNERLSKDRAMKSYSGSHVMKCVSFSPEGFNNTKNITWAWYEKTQGDFKFQHLSWTKINIWNDQYNITENQTHTSLKIRNINSSHEGVYKCMAYNGFGDDEHIFHLKVIGIYSLIIPFAVTLCLMIVMSIVIHVREGLERKRELMELMKNEEL